MCTSSVVNNHFCHLFVYLQAANEGLHVEALFRVFSLFKTKVVQKWGNFERLFCKDYISKMLSGLHLNLNIRTSGMALKHTHNPSVKDSFTITVLAMLDSYIGLTEIFILSTSLIPHLLSELELFWLYAFFSRLLPLDACSVFKVQLLHIQQK